MVRHNHVTLPKDLTRCRVGKGVSGLLRKSPPSERWTSALADGRGGSQPGESFPYSNPPLVRPRPLTDDGPSPPSEGNRFHHLVVPSTDGKANMAMIPLLALGAGRARLASNFHDLFVPAVRYGKFQEKPLWAGQPQVKAGVKNVSPLQLSRTFGAQTQSKTVWSSYQLEGPNNFAHPESHQCAVRWSPVMLQGSVDFPKIPTPGDQKYWSTEDSWRCPHC
jgi:hypothetical protein